MSEHEYLLPLTKWQRDLVEASAASSIWDALRRNKPELSTAYQAIYDKLRALEPIGTGGTGGTTEGNG